MKAGTPGFVGERLREARDARGITAVSLAETLGVTRAAIYQYESGQLSPRPQLMEKLSAVLNLPAAFFLRAIREEPSSAIFYRSLKSATQNDRARVERRMGWVHEISDAIRDCVELPMPNFPSFHVPDDPTRLSNEEIEQIALDARRFWGLDDGPLGSIVNLLENNGAIISRDDFLVDEVDALSQWRERDGKPYFLLNDRKQSAARSRLDLCHEIGHVILHRHLSKEDLAPVHKIVEQQAFCFAGAFALPAGSFVSELESGSLTLDFFQELKPIWKVSIGMMIKRAENLGLLNDDQTERLWRRRARNGWHLREPFDDELPIETPRLLPKAIHLALDNKLISRQKFLMACPFSTNDIEVLCNIEPGFLSEREATPRVLPFSTSPRKSS
jgi:Zn-dependent peptidase ImmA (M78 family)/DNA-binding XRE family transcriptional regulator